VVYHLSFFSLKSWLAGPKHRAGNKSRLQSKTRSLRFSARNLFLRVHGTDESVISIKQGCVMPRSHTDVEAVVIGLFPRASDARRALNILREHNFSADQAAAAFRDQGPARVETQQASMPARGSSAWFGQLRQIYHEDDRIENTHPGGTASTEFDETLSHLDLSSQDALILDRDLDRGVSIITVTAGDRNAEARTLLEQYGARIVHAHHPIDI
jgi:hypothetical protein